MSKAERKIATRILRIEVNKYESLISLTTKVTFKNIETPENKAVIVEKMIPFRISIYAI